MYGVQVNFGTHLSHDDLRDYYETACEGVVRANMLWRVRNPKAPQSLAKAGVRYEPPRHDNKRTPDLDTTPVILQRKRATCWPTACDMAAVLRLEDVPCVVKVIDVFDPEKHAAIKYNYHAVVLAGDQVYDPTIDLAGYNARYAQEEWYRNHGHCCPNCALGLTCASELGGKCGCDH